MTRRFDMPRSLSRSLSRFLTKRSVLTLCLILSLFQAGIPISAAEEVPAGRQVLDFRLDPRESLRVWEARFDLTDKDVHAGVFFIGREVATSDSLEIVRESLTRMRYSLTLRLRRGFMASGNGRLYLELFKGTPSTAEPFSPPTNLRLATAPHSFLFTCGHEGNHIAVTVFKRSAGAPLWEGIFHENCMWEITTDPLVVGGSYLLMASQCSNAARYSPPALLGFRVEATGVTCSVCKGVGWLGALPPTTGDADGETSKRAVKKGEQPGPGAVHPGVGNPPIFLWPGTQVARPVRPRPAGREYSEVCPYCRGTGVRLSPIAVPEPALPNAPDPKPVDDVSVGTTAGVASKVIQPKDFPPFIRKFQDVFQGIADVTKIQGEFFKEVGRKRGFAR